VAVEKVAKVVRREVGQKPQPPEIHSHQGDLRAFEPARNRQQRAVAPEDEDQVSLDGGKVLLTIRLDPDQAGPRMVREPVAETVQCLRHQWLGRVGDNEQAGHASADFRFRIADCEHFAVSALRRLAGPSTGRPPAQIGGRKKTARRGARPGNRRHKAGTA